MDTKQNLINKYIITTKRIPDSLSQHSGQYPNSTETQENNSTKVFDKTTNELKNRINCKWEESERSKAKHKKINAYKECIRYCNKYSKTINNPANEISYNSKSSLQFVNLNADSNDSESGNRIYRAPFLHPILCVPSNVLTFDHLNNFCPCHVNNQEYLCHLERKNAKLLKLIKKLRSKEKQDELKQKELCEEIEFHKVLWDNYIQDLKKKHEANPDLVNNYKYLPKHKKYKVEDSCDRCNWNNLASCMNVSNQIYSCSSVRDSKTTVYGKTHHKIKNNQSLCNIKQNKIYCYPTSCRAHLIIVPDEVNDDKNNTKETQVQASGSSDKFYDITDKGIDIEFESKNEKITNNLNFYDKSRPIEQSSHSDLGLLKNGSMEIIENKLDVLIQSVISFLDEIKEFKYAKPTNSTLSKFIEKAAHVIPGQNETSEIAVQVLNQYESSNIVASGQILVEETKKHDVHEFKRCTDNSIDTNYVNVYENVLASETLTKETSTEITKSLVTTQANEEKELVGTSCQVRETQTTIAVNTDPLGILDLVRISTKTIKKLLLNLPNLNMRSYLSIMSYLRAAIAFDPETRYTCNVCDANFGTSVDLSGHMKKHGSEPVRDCCVCRHMLDSKKVSTGNFLCQYCGQNFTRAYCCELHQVSCAKSQGKKHDANPGLMYLK